MKKYFFLLLLAMATTRLAAQEFDFNEVTKTPQATTFRLFAPRKAKVSVEIGPEFSSKEVGQTQKYKMRVWARTASGPSRSIRI